jgi:hypothetical protein
VTGLLGLLSAIMSASTLQRTTRESLLATNAIRSEIEELRRYTVKELPIFYGPGSFGETFDIPGLDPVPGDPVGQVGRVVIYTDETAVVPELGLPRDLDGDGAVGDTDVTDGRMILVPAQVTARWRGVNGVREITFSTLLARQ